MAGNQLSLTNVVNISVSAAQAGVGEYNTSNLAIFTTEDFDAESFGDDGFKIYLSPIEVGEDFGTDSQTYAMAVEVFSQKPNILAGNGYLVVIPLLEDLPAVTAVQKVSFSATPAAGSFKLKYGLLTSAAIAFDDVAADVQVALRALTGLSTITVAGDFATGFVVTFTGVTGPATLLTVTENSLDDASGFNIEVTVETTTPGQAAGTETLSAAIVRTSTLVQYFGLMMAAIPSQVDMLAAAATVQALNKIAFFVSNDEAAVASGGYVDLIRTGSLTQSRGLYYGSDTSADALNYMAAYAGRGLSTNFNGSNTTSTMHLKDLAGVQPDPSMTQSLLTLCQAAGADVYVSLQGVPKVFCSGANMFFDQVYNLQWWVGALQVAGFNYVAQSSTKIPQTESGMDGLKDAYRQVSEQARTNQYCAPGTWNSSTTFGNQADFLANISQRGYYIYSQPIGKQLQTARAARQAPLVQIALKEAGAIHSSQVIVNVNA
jgi:hypothetical protein